jgi:hypothetical protein
VRHPIAWTLSWTSAARLDEREGGSEAAARHAHDF